MKTVLVIDDDLAILEVMQLVLEEEGYKVTTDNGETAMQAFQDNQPNLVLLDIWMHGIDGREVSRQMRTIPQQSSTPIVLMSAHNHSDEVIQEADADAFIEKPFDIDDMLKVVKQYLE